MVTCLFFSAKRNKHANLKKLNIPIQKLFFFKKPRDGVTFSRRFNSCLDCLFNTEHELWLDNGILKMLTRGFPRLFVNGNPSTTTYICGTKLYKSKKWGKDTLAFVRINTNVWKEVLIECRRVQLFWSCAGISRNAHHQQRFIILIWEKLRVGQKQQ